MLVCVKEIKQGHAQPHKTIVVTGQDVTGGRANWTILMLAHCNSHNHMQPPLASSFYSPFIYLLCPDRRLHHDGTTTYPGPALSPGRSTFRHLPSHMDCHPGHGHMHSGAFPGIFVAVVDGGRLYDPLRDALMDNGIPVFTVCDKAIAALSLYIQKRLAADAIRDAHGFQG